MRQFFSDPRKLILADCCGASLTGLSTWFLLASELLPTGIPGAHLRYMVVAAFLFALIDFLVLYFSWKPSFFLRLMAVFNVGYCFCAFLSLIIFRDSVTNLGFVYFAVEIAIVLILATWEWSVARAAS